MIYGMKAMIVVCVVAVVLPVVAFSESGDRAWYLVRGNSGACSRFNADPTVFLQNAQQQPGGVFTDGHGASVADKSEVPGVIEQVIADGKGHIVGMVFVQGADACQRIAETMQTTHLMPYQQRAQAHTP